VPWKTCMHRLHAGAPLYKVSYCLHASSFRVVGDMSFYSRQGSEVLVKARLPTREVGCLHLLTSESVTTALPSIPYSVACEVWDQARSSAWDLANADVTWRTPALCSGCSVSLSEVSWYSTLRQNLTRLQYALNRVQDCKIQHSGRLAENGHHSLGRSRSFYDSRVGLTQM
jgi:hypothetical protein